MAHNGGAAVQDEPLKTAEIVFLPGVTLYVDHESWDYHITASPNHPPTHLRRILSAAEDRGLALLDQDACTPDLLADDSVRLYLQSAA
ncbi:hypothetical protein CIB93_08895 [Streptomyces sp. WZ.A104]|uniref:hypothetical protein n=1 Tax=Streptomyces sp. WZ.A104 TaxID=2023771 RepID=UPI000BBC178A|nr:hypothetical protein [Streptomyces sp. WZ.A104]PCG86345.1 hypothetical protein CIB93_08895 [Streptomyces sp. WZ.A104]